MAKGKKLLLIIVAVVLVLAVGIGLAVWAAVAGGSNTKKPTGPATTYTIRVSSEAGQPLKDVGLYIFEDSNQTELVSYIKTDDAGEASFTDVQRDSYVAVVDKVPTGYRAEPYYQLTGELTEIVLTTGTMSQEDMQTLTYQLGDAVMDFTVTGPDGTEYTLSGLFKDKKAVVLNFFYNGCKPCMLEFPHLQEAYAAYSDSIALIAMNPVDGDDASVAALQKELGLTFPMVKCDPAWEKIMQLSAYPTTVFIDRYGNICLIHEGSITDPKIFKDAFAYFSSDEYEPQLIKNIEDLAIEAPEGTEENPTQIGGQSSFETTVEPGQVVYHDLYKTFNMYLQIQSENAYVIYKGQTYYPKNGIVSLMVSSPDSFTPAKIGIGNSGTQKETFTVYLSALKGSYDNPYSLTIGDFDVHVNAGNEQGVYYVYTPTEDGTMTLTCLKAPKGVKYSYFLFNTVTSAMRNLEADAQTDDKGVVSVSVTAKAGQKIQICISTLPDDSNSYPAADFTFRAEFTKGEVKEEEKIPTTDFTVTVRDTENNPISNVSLSVMVDGKKTGYTTDQAGVAHIPLPSGVTYTGSLYVPEGYTAEKTDFTLTDEAPNVTLTVKKRPTVTYTVRVQGPENEAVAGVFVKVGDGQWLTTDSTGTVKQALLEDSYKVTIVVPAAYSGQTEYTFPEGSAELTITLGWPVGSRQNPANITDYPYTTPSVAAAGEFWCYVTALEDMLGISVPSRNATVRVGETTYTPDEKGIVRFDFAPDTAEPVLLVITNTADAAESFGLKAEYPWGTEKYPEIITQPGELGQRALPAQQAQGYYLSYTPEVSGIFTLEVYNPTGAFDVVLTTGAVQTRMSESDVPGRVTIGGVQAQQILIWIQPLAEPELAGVSLELTVAYTGNGEPPQELRGIYSVTVTDAFGAPMTGVGVIFMKDGAPVETVMTDAAGYAAMSQKTSGAYTAELFFSGTVYYYDKAAARMDDTNRGITVKLYSNLDESKFEPIYILNDNPAYLLPEGGLHVVVGSSRPNFSAEYEEYCFFVFAPTTDGTYRISSGTPGADVSLWGTTGFINKQYSSVEPDRENAVTISISGNTVGNVAYVIGVKAPEGVADVVLNVARIGDPAFSIADQPWHEWRSGLTHTDAWMNEVGMKPVMGSTEVLYYSLTKPVTYLDITAVSGTYNLYYDAANGYYRLYQGGPVILVDLNADRFVPLFERVNGNGQYGGSAVTRYFYDDAGSFLRKESYTEYLNDCFAEMKLDDVSETGYYPLTKDMLHVLQNGFSQWWDPESPNYLGAFATANKEYAWMFACGYIAN